MDDFERTIRQFLAHIDVERGLSKATVSAYGADLKKYRQWLADQGVGGIAAVTTQDVENYVAFLDESGESARSKARRLASIHAFHRFAVDEHSVADDVSAQVKAPKGASTLPDVLTIDEVARLLEAIPVSQNRAHGDASLEVPDDPVMLRDKALLEFMYATGARVSEAIGVKVGDVVLAPAACVHLHGKGRKQRSVPLWRSTVKVIRAWLKFNPDLTPTSALLPNRGGQAMTRSNVTQRLALAVKKAALTTPSLAGRTISPHCLRHSTAMHLLQSGVEISVIALWLGHESPATTHQYIEADLAMKEKALARLQDPNVVPQRFRADDDLLKFLKTL